MITKLRMSPLSGFKTIKPSQNTMNKYTLTIGHGNLHLSERAFRHFKGYPWFKFALNGHKLAVIESLPKDPCSIKFPERSKGDQRYYDNLRNTGLYSAVTKRMKCRPRNNRIKFIANKDDVYTNCIVFNLLKSIKKGSTHYEK